MKVWALIPAYNEEGKLERLLLELRRRGLSVLIVDDGSTDQTYDIAKEGADIVLKNEKNLGKGRSLRKGILYLLKNIQFDYVIIMDGDNQHSPFDIETFLAGAARNEPFLIGNRMDDPGQMPCIRRLTNRIMSWLISKIAGQYIPDTQCGFRLIRRDVLEVINIRANKFEIDSEIVIKASRHHFPITSVPIKSIYFKNHTSRINPFVDTLRFIRFVMKIKK